MLLPDIDEAEVLRTGPVRAFVGAYGFERRSLGWLSLQQGGQALSRGLFFRYVHSKAKGRNRIRGMRSLATAVGASEQAELRYDLNCPERIERQIGMSLPDLLRGVDEVVVDLSAMTKLLGMIILCSLAKFGVRLRVVYSEAEDYAPTKDEYDTSKEGMTNIAFFPSRGSRSIVRAQCLSSIRMQGQPVCLVAFTSFNEQLIRHVLGTLTPHRLIFIGSRHPRMDYSWREKAMQEIHQRLIGVYRNDNKTDENGLLVRKASTLHYAETFQRMDEIHTQFGTYERVICAATGSKMQTLGLLVSKLAHPDIHIEYPTPDSYYVGGLSKGVRKVHQICFGPFEAFAAAIARNEQG